MILTFYVSPLARGEGLSIEYSSEVLRKSQNLSLGRPNPFSLSLGRLNPLKSLFGRPILSRAILGPS